jgi:HSP20 family protein
MLYRTLFPRDIFAELDRLQREIQQSTDFSPSIRGAGRGGFPALNVGGTADSVEIYAFAPGLSADAIEASIDRGVLTISGERPAEPVGEDAKQAVHIRERFAGSFRRVVSLPEDIDPNAVTANYRDGVLHISIKRRTAAQPRRINVQ